MMTISSRVIATTLVSFMLATSAFAQTAATPAPAAPATSAAPAKAKPERSAASLACSKQADEKGLKGKERKKFRSQCKRDAAKAGSTTTDTTKAK
ncbi:PsiF family protein [Bradyrhizobium sp. SYSU BS000235]|uniref:PsiF family protein n=1 Tax=Bradyrhizobium sp. SYSU BS000235 TaxID=3411332 RepID=UPI003C709D65